MGKYQNISFHMSGLQKQLGPIQYRFDKVVVVEVSLCSANVLHGFSPNLLTRQEEYISIRQSALSIIYPTQNYDYYKTIIAWSLKGTNQSNPCDNR